MDKYTLRIIIACLIVFGATGFVLVKALIGINYEHRKHAHQIEPVRYLLNTRSMKSGSYSMNDTSNFVRLLKAFPCHQKSMGSNMPPWASAYLCEIARDTLQNRPDTILIIDVNPENIPDKLENFGEEITKSKQLSACTVSIPRSFRDSIGRVPYCYAHLAFWTDD